MRYINCPQLNPKGAYVPTITIIATLQAEGPRHKNRAVGVGHTKAEATKATLVSAEHFADKQSIRTLAASILDTFGHATPCCTDVLFEDRHWQVFIKW